MAIAITPEVIIGGLSVVGGAVLALKKSGLITFGKPAERRDCARKCADHERVVMEAKMTNETLKGDISDIREDIKRLEEKSDEREQRMQEEFKKLRELLGDLSGYVRAMHDKRA